MELTQENFDKLQQENEQLKNLLNEVVIYSEGYFEWDSRYNSNSMTSVKQSLNRLKEKVKNAKLYLIDKFEFISLRRNELRSFEDCTISFIRGNHLSKEWENHYENWKKNVEKLPTHLYY
jgi:hypothetical protein